MKVKKEMGNKTFIVLVCVIVALIVIFAGMAIKKKITPPKTDVPNISNPFDAKATIKMKDLVMEADINKTENGACTIKIKEPSKLKDMVFQYDGQDVKVSYKGMSVKLDDDSKLANSIASIIVKSIDKASSPSGVNVDIDGKKLLVNGESDAGKFQIALDKKTGSMLSLKVPQVDFECNFDDFVFKK